ncbi:MAG TPA: hypothetical protein VK582_07130 [Pyrinomonadaceae bacterium]|nr:hypothetical protein [Pyrinomonadaceae bacterium]
MPAVRTWKRATDLFEVIHTWEIISQADCYYAGDESTAAALAEPTDDQILATIVEKGMWLQRAVTAHWPVASELAGALSIHADLDNRLSADSHPESLYADSSRQRIAAAYLLWPYHSARYYGYSAVEPEERLESRTALCQIQGILYNNIRGVMDVLRLWFQSTSDTTTREFVAKPDKRREWRPSELTEHVPDLCAVDHLVEHLLELIKARPLIRKAIEDIQALSVRDQSATEVSTAVMRAFKEVRIAQMTVFYHPNPMEVKDRDEIPLYELVHETRDMDPIPAQLIPFEDAQDAKLARNFRKLASTIYSIRDKKRFPNFSAHRYSTISRLNDTTSFISDGAITNYFLSTKPPVQVLVGNGGSNGEGSESPSLWPLWYKQALGDFDFDKELPDWSDHFWWSSIGRDELRQLLFPGPIAADQLHQNDHMSSYWDELAATKHRFLERIEIPDEHPTGEPTFGYLMELLLRRERKTRTSFFFALAQTYEKQGRLCQFVGGTFLGLELPGVPFSKERFEAIAARVRGLVMAVAHYTTTHAYKTIRLQAAEERGNFGQRVELICRLLKGDDKKFHRNGYLLFASPTGDADDEGDDQTDHDYKPQLQLGWKPSRYQIKSVFMTANHLSQLPKTSRFSPLDCNNSWKALFYLGGTANIHHKLRSFRDHWAEYQKESPDRRRSELADRTMQCEGCFRATLEFLISQETYNGLQEKIIIKLPIRLPTRPGIRFLIALARFIVDVQSQASPENTQITGIEFSPASVVIDFDKPKLLQTVWEKKESGVPNFVHTTGIFMQLENSRITHVRGERDRWGKFLNSTEFAAPLIMEAENDWHRLAIRWRA